jgi:hypothetical protein
MAWLTKNGKGKEMFDRPDSHTDVDLDDRNDSRTEISSDAGDEAA